MKVVFFNCSIMTDQGIFIKKKVSLDTVKKLIAESENIESAIGHESTAQILSELTDIDIPVNRVKYIQQCDEIAVIFQLRSRPKEGKILSREEIEKTGYDFFCVRKYTKVFLGSGLSESFAEVPLFPKTDIQKSNPELLTNF